MSDETQVPSILRRLRPEARPLGWEALDAGQQDAFREVISWLSSATASLRERKSRKSGEYGGLLDPNRSSRIVMLAGERGSGKTTALLSVMQACLLFRRADAGIGGETGSYPGDLHSRLAELGRSLVWLEPLDMEPLPKSANLLAGILARIEAEADRASKVRDTPAEFAWSPQGLSGKNVEDPLTALMRLQTDVALTWDGNLATRGGSLDPDIYATEVMRAEKARLMLNRRMADLLDGLADKVFRSPDLLFVLPIDDCDLNPALIVPLLRFLRLISVPRLFTILLGDEQMARTVFRLKYQGELIEAAAPTGTYEQSRDQGRGLLSGTADEVGLNALRKLLPPGQRIYLRPMRARTALDYPAPTAVRQLRLVEGTGDVPSVRRMLSEFRLRPLWPEDLTRRTARRPPPPRGFDVFARRLPLDPDDYIRIESIIDIIEAERLAFIPDKEERPVESQEPGRRRSAYSGRAFFRQPARRVLDLWARLYGIHTSPLTDDDRRELSVRAGEDEEGLRRKKVRQLLNYWAEQARQAIDEDSELPVEVRSRLMSIIERNWEGDFELDAYYLKLVSPPEDPVPTRARIKVPRPKITAFLTFQEVNDWFLAARTPELRVHEVRSGELQILPQEPEEQSIRASRPLRAALTLFSDYVAMHDRGRLARGSIRPDPFELRCATAHWRTRDGLLDHKVYWPAPDWESLWPYDLLTTAWSEGVRWLNPRRQRFDETDLSNAEFFAFLWILTATCLVARVIPKRVPGRIPPSEKDWERLVEAVAELVTLVDRSRMHRHIRTWLIHLPCLLAPECGLSPRVAEYFVGAKGGPRNSCQERLFKFWSDLDNAEEVRFARARVMSLDDLEMTEPGRLLARYFGARDEKESTQSEQHPINAIAQLRPRMYSIPSSDLSQHSSRPGSQQRPRSEE